MTGIGDKLTERELAIELKRSPGTLTRWRRERRGPPFYRCQGRVLYSLAEVQAWLESQRQDHERPPPRKATVLHAVPSGRVA